MKNSRRNTLSIPRNGSWRKELEALNSIVFITQKKVIPNEDCVTLGKCDKNGNLFTPRRK